MFLRMICECRIKTKMMLSEHRGEPSKYRAIVAGNAR